MSKPTVDRQFRKLEITSESQVKVKFVEIITSPPDHPENDNKISVRKYSVESEDIPHKDLINLLKKLRPHALASNEMEVEEKTKSQYNVTTVQVDGDVLMKKSRVRFTMTHDVERTGKGVPIGPGGQITMYGDSDYHDHEKMSKIIEELIGEVWEYLGGKYSEESVGQLPLFSPLELV